MLVYAMVQELATALNYRNLRRRVHDRGGDPALSKLLMYVSVDEQAHYGFFRDCVRLFLKHDPDAVLEQMRRVMNNFAMPAIYDMADSRQRVAGIKALDIFTEDIYYREVYLPVLAALGVDRKEMRNRLPSRKSVPSGVTGDAGPSRNAGATESVTAAGDGFGPGNRPATRPRRSGPIHSPTFRCGLPRFTVRMPGMCRPRAIWSARWPGIDLRLFVMSRH